MSYVVTVTFGNTLTNATFASGIKERLDAVKLKELATRLGYDDAEVISAESYKQIRAAAAKKWSSARGITDGGREVRDMRARA